MIMLNLPGGISKLKLKWSLGLVQAALLIGSCDTTVPRLRATDTGRWNSRIWKALAQVAAADHVMTKAAS